MQWLVSRETLETRQIMSVSTRVLKSSSTRSVTLGVWKSSLDEWHLCNLWRVWVTGLNASTHAHIAFTLHPRIPLNKSGQLCYNMIQKYIQNSSVIPKCHVSSRILNKRCHNLHRKFFSFLLLLPLLLLYSLLLLLFLLLLLLLLLLRLLFSNRFFILIFIKIEPGFAL